VLFHLAVLAVIAGAVAALNLTASLAREIVFSVISASTIPAIAVGLRVNRVTHRLPWRLAIVSMSCLSVGNAWQALLTAQHSSGAFRHPLTQVLMLTAYLCLLAASLLLVLRQTPHDRGRVIEAALVGLVGAGLVWEAVLLPNLDARPAPVPVKMAVLVQVLTLLAVLGTLLKLARVVRLGRVTVAYLFLALVATLANVVFTTILPVSGGGPLRGVVTGIWSVAYLCLAAAALHPGVTAMSRFQGGGTPEDLSPVRLAYLGAALWVCPLLGAVPMVLNRTADVLLLVVGPLLIIPLVLVRIRQIVAQRSRDQHALAYQAAHDELTGLLNRRAFFQRAEEALRTSERVAILYCDLDGFKPVNDTLGHRAGDEVLKTVARRLGEYAGPDDVVGRVGGDEFLILRPCTSEPECRDVAGRIEDGCRAPIPVDGTHTRVGVTVGYAIAERGVRASADALVAAADVAMYERKRGKRRISAA
jgi:diguanylate cyclase (GGDEF)-like protein